jgi:hypothetical protein
MVRTICCESYKICGRRCSLCPGRVENQAAILRYQQAVAARQARLLLITEAPSDGDKHSEQ